MLFLGKHSKPLDETEMDVFFTTLKIYLYTVKVAKRSGEQNRDLNGIKCVSLYVSVCSNVEHAYYLFSICVMPAVSQKVFFLSSFCFL